MKHIFPLPINESDKTLVNFEFLKGIWVLYLSVNAYIQFPKIDKEPLIQVNSLILTSLSQLCNLCGILNFSETLVI